MSRSALLPPAALPADSPAAMFAIDTSGTRLSALIRHQILCAPAVEALRQDFPNLFIGLSTLRVDAGTLASEASTRLFSRFDCPVYTVLHETYRHTTPNLAALQQMEAAAVCLEARARQLFRALAVGAITAEGINAATHQRQAIDRRDWGRSGATVQIAAGSLLDLNTSTVDWKDIILSPATGAAADDHASGAAPVRQGGGRPPAYDWDAALDCFLLAHIKEAEFDTAAHLIAAFAACFQERGVEPDESRIRKELRRRFPRFYARAKTRPDS